MKILQLLLLFASLNVAANENQNQQQFIQKAVNEQQQKIASYAQEIDYLKSQSKRQSKQNFTCSAQEDEVKSFATALNTEKNIAEKNTEHKQLQSSKSGKKTKTIVFVSFSMPALSLRQWLDDAHKFGANVVIRGLKNNSFKDTALELTHLLEKNNAGGIELNPNLFKDFKIIKVPAVVVLDEATHDFDVVYGNVSLKYALGIIANKK